MSSKKIKAQMRVFQELENQLLIQADKLGVKDDYNPIKIKEMEYDALKNHLLSFYSERSNIEYEMQVLGTDKKEVLIKLEKLEIYIKRAERLLDMYKKYFGKVFKTQNEEKEKIEKFLTKSRISVSVGEN